MKTRRWSLPVAIGAVLLMALPAAAEPRDDDLADACEGAPETTFTDEGQLTDEEEQATDCLAADGWDNIARGFEDGSYGPREDVRREQMAGFVARLLDATGVALPSNPPNAFDDDDDSFFHLQINQLADLGIIAGRPDTNDADDDGDTDENLYFPKEPVRRDQMAKFVLNALEATSGEDLEASEDQFPDEDCDDSLEPAVNALAEENIVQGTGGGVYDCDADVSRGQMSLFLARTLDWLVENGFEDNPFQEVVGGLIDAPELISVSVENSGSDFVNLRFEFDEPVTGKTPDEGCFHLYSFDLQDYPSGDNNACAAGHSGDDNDAAVSADGMDAFVDPTETTDVLVQFGLSPSQFDAVTTATVDFEAVADAGGLGNPEGDAPVQEVAMPGGETSAPDLELLTAFDATDDTVDFEFDEEVGAVLDQNAFLLVETDGDVKRSDAAEISPTDPTHVVATFTDGANDDGGEDPTIVSGQQSSTARGVAEAGAVSDTEQDEETEGTEGDVNVLQVAEVSDFGFSDDPDLLQVTIDAENGTVAYEFDEPVEFPGSENTDATCDDAGTPFPVILDDNSGLCFHVYDRNADEVAANSAERSSSNPEVVIAEFDTGDLVEAIGASVDDGAVQNTTGEGTRLNEADELPVPGQQIDAGRTTGPDLVEAFTRTTGDPIFMTEETVAVFVFDEAVSAPDASRFWIYDQDGTAHEGQSAAAGDNPNEIEVTFSSSEVVQGAVLAGVNDDAVEDSDANTNPEGSEPLEQESE